MKKNIVLITLIAMCIGSQLQAKNGQINRPHIVTAYSLNDDAIKTTTLSADKLATLAALSIIVLSGQIAPDSLLTALVKEAGNSVGTLSACVENTRIAQAFWKLIDIALN